MSDGDLGGKRRNRWGFEDRWRVGIQEILSHHVGHGGQHGSIGLVEHVRHTGEGVQVTLGSWPKSWRPQGNDDDANGVVPAEG
jgi:hypothetical protein